MGDTEEIVGKVTLAVDQLFKLCISGTEISKDVEITYIQQLVDLTQGGSADLIFACLKSIDDKVKLINGSHCVPLCWTYSKILYHGGGTLPKNRLCKQFEQFFKFCVENRVETLMDLQEFIVMQATATKSVREYVKKKVDKFMANVFLDKAQLLEPRTTFRNLEDIAAACGDNVQKCMQDFYPGMVPLETNEVVEDEPNTSQEQIEPRKQQGVRDAFRDAVRGFRRRVKIGRFDLKEFPTEINRMVDLGDLRLKDSSFETVLSELNYGKRAQPFELEEALGFLWIYIGLVQKGGVGREVSKVQEESVNHLFIAAVSQDEEKNCMEHILYLWKQVQLLHSSSTNSAPFHETKLVLKNTFPLVNFDVPPAIMVELTPTDFFQEMQPRQNPNIHVPSDQGSSSKDSTTRRQKTRKRNQMKSKLGEWELADSGGVPRRVKKLRK